jgi:hypothetical protein
LVDFRTGFLAAAFLRRARRDGLDIRRFAILFGVLLVFRAAFRVRAVALRFAITGVLSGSSRPRLSAESP